MLKETIGKYRWTICALLFFATTVNYLDRQVLSLLQTTLSEKFNWSNSDYANITAVFQFGYAISMLFAGRIIDKLGTKKGYTWAIIIWSIGAIIHALAIPIGASAAAFLGWFGIISLNVSIIGFMISRAVLAFGEAGNFPSAIKATADYFPKKERNYERVNSFTYEFPDKYNDYQKYTQHYVIHYTYITDFIPSISTLLCVSHLRIISSSDSKIFGFVPMLK